MMQWRRLEMASLTSNAERSLKPPATITELKSFLRLCIIFRRVIDDFTCVMTLLKTKLYNQVSRFRKLTVEQTVVMKDLLDKQNSPLLLAISRHCQKYTLDSDDCNEQVGYIPLQEERSGENLSTGY